MARLLGPLFSENAHGSLGKRLTFSQRSSGNQARFQRANHDTNSSSQQTQRSFFLLAIAAWNSLADSEKELWNVYNKG